MRMSKLPGCRCLRAHVSSLELILYGKSLRLKYLHQNLTRLHANTLIINILQNEKGVGGRKSYCCHPSAPTRGTKRHRSWRVTEISLPSLRTICTCCS